MREAKGECLFRLSFTTASALDEKRHFVTSSVGVHHISTQTLQ